MSEEKRMIENYEIVSSLTINGTEIALLVADIETENRFGCCYIAANSVATMVFDFTASDNYLDMVETYTERINNAVLTLKLDLEKSDIPFDIMTEDDCDPIDYDHNLIDNLVAVKSDVLCPEYQRIEHQLYLVTGGFGAYANARGRKVYGKNVATGKQDTFYREDLLGTVKPECTPMWAVERLRDIMQNREKHNRDSR